MKKSSILELVLLVGALLLVSSVFWKIASETSKETWAGLGYLGSFVLGLIGALSVIIPLPTTFALLAVAAMRQLDATLLALAFGSGAAIGQLSSYVVGYFGRTTINEKYNRRLDAILKLLNRYRYGMFLVFIFALTPLPDSLLFIPLGVVRYSLWRVFVSALAGKILMSLIITHFGSAVGVVVAENPAFTIATIIMLVLVIVAMFKVNWEELVQKYLPQENRRK